MIQRAMHVDFLRILHKEDSQVGINGQAVSEHNPPSYLAGALDEIRLVSQCPCCEAMAERVQDQTIEFGSRREEAYHNKLADVFIRIEGGAQVVPEDGRPPKEGAISSTRGRISKPNTDIALAYCPWCTAPIETHEVSTI